MAGTRRTTDWRIGTSGWSYEHWKGIFYPEDLPKSRWFEYYTENFDTVEINYTFYSTPKKTTLEKWFDTSPKDFRFVLKMSRFITHRKKLRDVAAECGKFFDLAATLEEKLGPILHQLPPSMKFENSFDVVGKYLGLLPREMGHAIEFRDNSWVRAETFDLLREHGAAYCVVSAPRLERRLETTAPFAYVRFHGSARWYSHDYPDDELEEWARDIRKWKSRGISGYAFFNNDFEACAMRNAMTLRGKL